MFTLKKSAGIGKKSAQKCHGFSPCSSGQSSLTEPESQAEHKELRTRDISSTRPNRTSLGTRRAAARGWTCPRRGSAGGYAQLRPAPAARPALPEAPAVPCRAGSRRPRSRRPPRSGSRRRRVATRPARRRSGALGAARQPGSRAGAAPPRGRPCRAGPQRPLRGRRRPTRALAALGTPPSQSRSRSLFPPRRRLRAPPGPAAPGPAAAGGGGGCWAAAAGANGRRGGGRALRGCRVRARRDPADGRRAEPGGGRARSWRAACACGGCCRWGSASSTPPWAWGTCSRKPPPATAPCTPATSGKSSGGRRKVLPLPPPSSRGAAPSRDGLPPRPALSPALWPPAAGGRAGCAGGAVRARSRRSFSPPLGPCGAGWRRALRAPSGRELLRAGAGRSCPALICACCACVCVCYLGYCAGKAPVRNRPSFLKGSSILPSLPSASLWAQHPAPELAVRWRCGTGAVRWPWLVGVRLSTLWKQCKYRRRKRGGQAGYCRGLVGAPRPGTYRRQRKTKARSQVLLWVLLSSRCWVCIASLEGRRPLVRQRACCREQSSGDRWRGRCKMHISSLLWKLAAPFTPIPRAGSCIACHFVKLS